MHCDINMKVTNKMQLYRLIYFSFLALHVLSNVFAHHQEHLTVFTLSGSIHLRLLQTGVLDVLKLQFQLIHDIMTPACSNLGWILPDSVNTVKCS